MGHSGHYKKRGRRGQHGTIMLFELKWKCGTQGRTGSTWLGLRRQLVLCPLPLLALGGNTLLMRFTMLKSFVPVASVNDDIVQCGPARCVVECFEVELRDGAEGHECTVRRWVEVHGGVLSWVEDEGKASRGEVRCFKVLKEFCCAQEALKEPQLERVELREMQERDEHA